MAKENANGEYLWNAEMVTRDDILRIIKENRSEIDYLIWNLASGSRGIGRAYPGYGFMKDDINNRITYACYLEYCLGFIDADSDVDVKRSILENRTFESFMEHHFGKEL